MAAAPKVQLKWVVIFLGFTYKCIDISLLKSYFAIHIQKTANIYFIHIRKNILSSVRIYICVCVCVRVCVRV